MSTILKALRRLEEQKSDTAQRPLRDEVVIQPSRRAGPSVMGVALTAFAAFAVVGGLLSWLLRGELAVDPAPEQPSPPPVATAPPPPVAPAPAPEVALAPSEQVEVAEEDLAIGSVPVPASPDEFQIVRPDAAAEPRALAPPALPRVTTEIQPTARRYQPPPIPSKYESVMRMPPLEDDMEAAASAPGSKRPGSVRVDRTQWHPAPERRLAWVEVPGIGTLREVREGERIGSYLVLEIEPAAVVFSNGGTELRREIGR